MQGAKRQSEAAAAGSASGGVFQGGGYGPGQAQAGWDVPHFDREAHLRTQEQQERRWMLRRRAEGEDAASGGAGMLIQFLLVSGVVSFALVAPSLFERNAGQRRETQP